MFLSLKEVLHVPALRSHGTRPEVCGRADEAIKPVTASKKRSLGTSWTSFCFRLRDFLNLDVETLVKAFKGEEVNEGKITVD